MAADLFYCQKHMLLCFGFEISVGIVEKYVEIKKEKSKIKSKKNTTLKVIREKGKNVRTT